jgi:hypothetical protein
MQLDRLWSKLVLYSEIGAKHQDHRDAVVGPCDPT